MSRFGSLVAAFFIVAALPALAQPRGLVSQLQRGGYVLVMRHAHAPQERPARQQADPMNGGRERQLDGEGLRTARALGAALRRLHIPVGQVLSSPTYRARETARLAGFPAPILAGQLGDGGRSMQRLGGGDWLRRHAAERPARGTNTLIVTQMPNITAAFPQDGAGLSDGETLMFRTDGRMAHLVARIKITEWARMEQPGIDAPERQPH